MDDGPARGRQCLTWLQLRRTDRLRIENLRDGKRWANSNDLRISAFPFLRSGYLAEANVDAASIYLADGWGPWGYGWWGADWYWDPWFDAFTFIPGDGIFFSPFGWDFTRRGG
jgi:hypothetical protein